jgi:hypothetical protein
MATLSERLQPTGPAIPGYPSSEGADVPLWLRYADLVRLGFSSGPSLAGAHVATDPIARVLGFGRHAR